MIDIENFGDVTTAKNKLYIWISYRVDIPVESTIVMSFISVDMDFLTWCLLINRKVGWINIEILLTIITHFSLDENCISRSSQ